MPDLATPTATRPSDVDVCPAAPVPARHAWQLRFTDHGDIEDGPCFWCQETPHA